MSHQHHPLTRRRFVLASLRHYRGTHAMVVVGVAVAVAVLSGALLVGASVRTSLRELALGRLGNTAVALASATSFREALAEEIGAVPLIALSGALVHEDSGRTSARVQIFGIDDRFSAFHGLGTAAPADRDAWLSPALAGELGATPGDSVLLRIARLTDIPLSTLQGRRDQASQRIRLAVARIADRSTLGEFSLVPAQGPALTIFVPLARLQRDLGLDGRVNAALAAEPAARGIESRLRERAVLDDYGLRIRPSSQSGVVVVESRTGVLAPELVESLDAGLSSMGTPAAPVLTHLANVIRVGDREIPYSLVTAREQPPGIVLNAWAAGDLETQVGDEVTLDYYVWSDETGLEGHSASFVMSGVAPMQGDGGDPTFTPDYPGLTDAADVMAWDPPFPIDLRRVRPRDETYWDEWHTAPKAFVPLDVGQQLWATPHGRVSSLRVTAPEGQTADGFAAVLADGLRASVTPAAGGLLVRDARGEALAAAEGTTDFGEYFTYFSFFIVVAGLLLAALFFALSVEQRAREVGLLGAVGAPPAAIRRLLMLEGGVLALAGAILGTIGAVAYAAVIMYGLRTWWIGAVGTTALTLHVDPVWLAAGAAAAMLAALAALLAAFRGVVRATPRALLTGAPPADRDGAPRKWVPRVSATALVAAILLVAAAAAGGLDRVAAFFGAGGLLMIAGLGAFAWWLGNPRRPSGPVPGARGLVAFGADYARWRPSRSVLSAALITFACFVLISVGAFRRDLTGGSLERDGGTGGFVLMAESIVPLMHDPNTRDGRADLALPDDAALERAQIVRFRLRPGDEASCLTLYRPTNPRIVAPEQAFLDERRFRFSRTTASTSAERENPWLLLHQRFDDGAIPAIVDQTSLTYVFHLGVGDDFVFTPDGEREVRLRVVAALADSVLQSEVIVGEHDFVRLFPRQEGYRLWMIEAPAEDAEALATLLEDRLADYGMDVSDTRARLAAYHQVENTYLSTFQALGGLGLLVGTLGLAAVLARNVLERRRELGLLGAIGFTPSHVRTLVVAESLLLVGCGVVLGTLTALVAIAPAVLERAGALPFGSLALLLIAVVATGVLASLGAARVAARMSVVEAIKSE